MFSMASVMLQSGAAVTCSNGYRFTTSKSMPSMPCSRHHRIVDAAPAEQATVDFRMQGLDAAVHDFRKPGHVADVAHADTGLAQCARSATGGNQARYRAYARPRARSIETGSCRTRSATRDGSVPGWRRTSVIPAGSETAIIAVCMSEARSAEAACGEFLAQGRAIDAECCRRLLWLPPLQTSTSRSKGASTSCSTSRRARRASAHPDRSDSGAPHARRIRAAPVAGWIRRWHRLAGQERHSQRQTTLRS